MKPMAALVTVPGDRALRGPLPVLTRCNAIGATAVAIGPGEQAPSGRTPIRVTSRWSSDAVTEIGAWLGATEAEYLLWILDGAPELLETGVARLLRCARDSGAAITYGDFFDLGPDGTPRLHPLIDYQPGSLRDDFDFGGVVLLRADLFGKTRVAEGLTFGGWYDVRLQLSELGSVLHVPEPLYGQPMADARASGERVFDYVDPRRRDYQIEMERVATDHLRRIGAWLPPPTGEPVAHAGGFPVTASVVIPVRNRVATIGDAVRSALSQEASFSFNVIVVDNHSDDGTSEELAAIADRDSRLVHLRPTRWDLGIGGCWQEAIESDACGCYAVQLDSDDTYAGVGVLARIVGELERGRYAAVIGSYTTVSFELEPLPPGLVDHREWSDDNGHNNALRIAGLGAPRAFHVPTLRSIGFPNVSYGEDYGVMLQLCRRFRLGRIYESLYWCRRWEGNSDSALPLETSNRYHLYKDRLRTVELAARRELAAR